MTFGLAFSRRLCLAAARMGVPISWICAKICLETGGTWDPLILQAGGRIVAPDGDHDMRPEVFGRGGKRLSHGSGARGLFQVMATVMTRPAPTPPLMVLYPVTDPVQQLDDHVTRALGWLFRHGAGTLRSREAYYCMNLAPARLIGGQYDDETIVYSANPEDEWLNNRPNGALTYWPAAYRDNAKSFGLEPHDPGGRIRMKRLAVGLDAWAQRARARYDAEIVAANVANLAS